MSDPSAPAARLSAALADRYRIERELGAGGMATVYLARDVKHDREVALKVLRPELAAVLGAERFLNEVRITARLDHPHILTLIDSGESDGFLWYALPFIRGESLRATLERERQLGIDEALAITRQIANALDFAHQHGVVHRDIKPENILLHEGEAMLADFGIALAVKEAGGNRITETGLSLGTPQYMSPEQATGDRQVDARSDVYSLGAVLYEMLAGEPPVTGPTAQAIIAKLLTERPTRLRVVRDSVPEGVDLAVAKALAKTPADRFASAGDFVAAFHATTAAAPRSTTPWHRRTVLFGVAAAVAVAVLAFGASRLMRGRPPGFALGRSEQLTADPGLEIQPALSPDGRVVAYAAGNAARMRIFIRPVGGGRTLPLTDDSTAVEAQPRWSPDGNSLLFLARGGVSIAPALGGASRPVVPPSATAHVATAAWAPNGREIVFVRAESLLVAPVEGGPARLLATTLDLHSCTWSPAGKWIACVTLNAESVLSGTSFGNLAPSAILLFPAAGGAPARLVEPQAFNQSPVWTPDGGRLLFISNRDGPRDVYAMTLSSSGRPRGALTRLTTGLGAISISLSADGRRLVYAAYSARANIWSLPIPTGAPVTADRAIPVTSGNQVIEAMRVSRDGRWLLYDSDLRGNSDIYRMPVNGGPAEQLTDDPADEFAPDLSPDGRAITYHSWRTGTRDIEVRPLDGGPVEHITATPRQESLPRWSPDGQAIAFYNRVSPFSLFITRREASGRWATPTLLASSTVGDSWSPDGRSIAYIEAESDARAGPVMVVPAEGGSPRRVFDPTPTAPPGDQAEWSPDGRTLYYKAHDSLGRASFWSVSAAGGRPRLLVRFTDLSRPSSRRDFATDGRRFYFAIEDRQSDVFVAELITK
ncbi:MAG TPA: protein kinase [Gemmatimonadales bacterium]|nr:protein kinase [Gemmatimonadales bacterium]